MPVHEEAEADPSGTPASPAVPAPGDLTPRPVVATPSGSGATRSPAVAAIQAEVERLLAPSRRWNGEWSILAISLASGDTLVAVEADQPLAPASNQKVVTSAAALHHLGPEYRFSTYLLADGPVRDGVLHGDLILFGTGDPTFGDPPQRGAGAAFPAFLAALREMGIEEVRGDVVGDESYFEGPFRRPAWNPGGLNDWYAARVSALTFNENVATLRVRPSSPGRPPLFSTLPEAAGLPIENRALTTSDRPRTPFMAIRDDPDTPIVLWGQLPAGSREVWRVITVSDPARYAASVFRTRLEEEGISVSGGVRAVRDPELSRVRHAATGGGEDELGRALRTVAVHRSPPLHALLRAVNGESHNLFAELLLFTLGRAVHGTGSFEAGTRVLEDFLSEVIGVGRGGLVLDDGSGLSPENRIPASALTRVLEHLARADYGEAFWASLPTAGDRRGLRRMYRSAAAGNLRAKTGTIRRVSSLSGIVHTRDGEPVLFSILSNRVGSSAAKGIEDRIGVRLASFSRGDEGVPVASAGGATLGQAGR